MKGKNDSNNRKRRSPFLSNNSRRETLSQILALRADREIETKVCLDNLLYSNSNIFLFGERGIGCSSLPPNQIRLFAFRMLCGQTDLKKMIKN